MTFKNHLLNAIKDWSEIPIEDEWIFEKFRTEFVNHMPGSDAFLAINETIGVLQQQSDESTATEVMQTLIALARQSNTTERPSEILAQKAALETQFSSFDSYAKSKLNELFRYYRL